MSAIENQLLKLKKQSEEREAKRKAVELGLEYLDLTLSPVETEALHLIPEERARELRVTPVELKARHLTIGAFDPTDPKVQVLLKELEAKNYQVKIGVVSLPSLERGWSFYQYVTPGKTPLTTRLDIKKEELESLSKKLTDFSAVAAEINNFDFQKSPTGEVLEIILAGGLANRVSDIHLEPESEAVKIRFRVDGLLHDIVNVPKTVYDRVVNRIKLLANLKLNLQDQPQDGRITIGLAGREVEARVSTVPAEFGETIVMRILDPEVIKVDLTELGLGEDDLAIAREELKKPNGLILVTGPTGAGKTTTLYAFLRAKQKPEIKIITIEDPIEYHLSGIEQTQVDADSGYAFANGLRSIMRQDPDVILVGEIRDLETVEIAVQAALTGHLVFSTAHANSAAGTIPRLLDLGVKAGSIGPALNLIIAQRLVRRLCQKCKKSVEPSAELKIKIEKSLNELPARVDKNLYQEWKLFMPIGCPECSGTGYRGRVGIFELLKVGHEAEELITKESTEADMEKLAREQGMVTLQQDGILKVVSGITTIEEIETAAGK